VIHTKICLRAENYAMSKYKVKIKVKVKSTLEQAMKAQGGVEV
jgi:hypothetical protein